MCPLRLVLVFFSAILAGFLAWKSINSSIPSPSCGESTEVRRGDSSVKSQIFAAGKVIVNGFWAFLDMASGRYLWRMIKGQ